MNTINIFFNKLKLHSGAIWLENDTIKIFVTENLKNQETKDFILNNRSELIAVLKENRIFSKDTFSNLSIFTNNNASHYPLSSGQERLWFIEQYEEGTNAYHIPLVLELDKTADTEAIKYALQQIVSRHEILRTTIAQDENQEDTVQNVLDEPLYFEEISVNTTSYKAAIEEAINRPFNLSTEYPIRVAFYKIQSTKESIDKTLLLINTHHIASDGWSMDIFKKELIAFYEAYSSGNKNFNLPALQIQYKDYASWQKSYLTGDTLKIQLEYWKEKLCDYQILDFHTDYARPALRNYEGKRHEFTINKATSTKLRALAQQYGITLNSVMLSSVNILLSKYTGKNDIVMGSPIANRHHRQTEDLIGFFVNMQINRTFLSNDQLFDELIQQVHQDQIAAQLHQDLPFEKLIDELGVERDASRHPIFQIMFGIQNFDRANSVSGEQKNYFTPYEVGDIYQIEKFDLSFFIDDSREELLVRISYATSLFHPDTITGLGDHYLHLLEQLTLYPNKPYSEIGLLNGAEYQKIVCDWNATSKPYFGQKTLHEMFMHQAKTTPFTIALVFENEELTYQELNEKSNQLAREIREQYQKKTGKLVTPDTLIALCLERSLEMVIAMLAVLKAGAAYVPIDPEYPQERIDYILEDTNTELILVQKSEETAKRFKLSEDKILCVDLKESLYQLQDKENLAAFSQSTDLAYVIYTSGTTGKPKGVMIEHDSAIYYLLSFKNLIHSDHINMFAVLNYCFDAALPTLLSGTVGSVTTHISANNIFLNESVENYIIQNKINTIRLTPSLLETLNLEDINLELNIVMGGEIISYKHVNEIILNKNIKLYNQYGPTESTVGTTVFRINKKISQQIIGKPYDGKRIFILDSNNMPVPAGSIGELHIGGAGLARGYLNRTALTAERFVLNSFATALDTINGYTRLYKTGDMARWLSDGTIEYIGRNDDQVKIRGYRIELGEIEQVMSQINGIDKVCVLVKERKTTSDRTKYLVAYYVANSDIEALESSFIKTELSKKLPDYMLPTILVAMKSFPLTVNGKLDKRALPEPELSAAATNFVAPNTQTERRICEIWKELLGLEKAGLNDDFFKLGGNSILAIKASHRMSKVLGSNLKVADVFKYKTISQLLLNTKDKSQIVIPKTTSAQKVLSFAQERLWFIDQYEQGTHAYNMPALFELDPNTDKEGLKYALQQITARHEVLRSTINQASNQENGTQVVHDDMILIEEKYVTNTNDYHSVIKKDSIAVFNLNKEYPIRTIFYNIVSESEIVSDKILLLINIHHIACDGWSLEIFKKELFAYYQAYINKDTSFRLPDLEIQYKDYAAWQRHYLTEDVLEKQLSYWKSKLSGYQTLEIPVDYPRPNAIDYKGANFKFTINKDISEKLRLLAKNNGLTLNSVMLGSINILFGKYTGQNDIVIGSVTANRHHSQTQELIGFFVNTQANRTILKESQTFTELIHEVHQDQIEAQLYQDLPFEKLIDELAVERDSSRHPVFQVVFSVKSFTNEEQNSLLEETYLKAYEIEEAYDVAKFDLSILVEDHGEELIGQINYATSLFNKESISRLADYYIFLLDQLTATPDKIYNEISLLNPTEYNKIIYDWNAGEKEFTMDKSIVEIFEEHVKNTPHNIAVVFEDKELTYQELDKQSNNLAAYLLNNHDIQGDDLIGIMLDRSEKLIVVIFAILKTGAAYVYIDPEYPLARKKYIIEDTSLNILFTHTDYSSDLDFYKGNTFEIDLKLDLIDTVKTTVKKHIKPQDLAYLVYTSGTTGQPKGVMVEHYQVLLLVLNNNFINYDEVTVVAGLSNYSFDGSIFDLFFPLLNGKKLVLFDKNSLLDLSRLDDQFIKLKIDTVLITTALFNSLVQFQSKCFDSLQQIIFGGERCNIEIVNKFKNLYKKTTLIHAYGPAENIVYSTYCNLNDYDTEKIVPIGKHLSDKKLYVLSPSQTPVPIGITGELFIGGPGMARGYLNRPDLTAERFVENPFSTPEDKKKGYDRLYKTGDLVRWLADGNIEYVGRNDDQVKIRGYRIELGEIEHALSQINGIRQVCVLVKERNSETGTTKYLVGYYVPDSSDSIVNETMIHTSLSGVLPDYMIPTALIAMDSLPLTINGKLDKRALPDPESRVVEADYVASTNEIEALLCTIWQTVLNVDKVSILDNFFRIGGDSILSIQVSRRITQAGFNCQVKDIFEYKTIAKLAEHLNVKKSKSITISEQGILAGPLGLLPVQQWFLEKTENREFAKPNHWNQSFLIKVPELDLKKLEKSITTLVSYHDALRIFYRKEFNTETGRNTWQQCYQSDFTSPDIKTVDVSKLNEKQVSQILTGWQSNFDLEKGILFQIGYLHGYEDGSARIYFALHHMIVDGVSWRILAEDLKSIYEQKALLPKGNSYRQWVEEVKKYAVQNAAEASYWETQLKGKPAYNLASNLKESSSEVIGLDTEQTKSLLQQASKAYNTNVNDLLLTAFAYALREINHNNIQTITLEGHGREDLENGLDHSRTVGWFTSMFPVKLEVQDDFKATIQFIKESLRNIPNKGIGFGAFATNNKNKYSYKDMTPITFNYLGQFNKEQDNWQIVSEFSGKNVHADNLDHNIINVNGVVSNGEMDFSVTTKLGKTVTKKLSDSFKIALTQIITHCTEQLENKGTIYSPSDLEDFVPFEIFNGHLKDDPIFIFPPGSAGMESYYNTLVPFIKNKKLVVFNNFLSFMKKREVNYKSEDTIQDLTKYYRILIQKLQPKGKYTFVGWSFGGVLAFELFEQLFTDNLEGSNLFLLDSYFDYRGVEKYLPSHCLDYFTKTIHYRYTPKYNLEGLNIVLFKAAKTVGWDDNDEADSLTIMARHTQKFYVESPYNGLDKVLVDNTRLLKDKFQVIRLDCHHDNILETSSEIISEYILSTDKENILI